MRLESKTLVCGVSARDLRDLFRRFRDGLGQSEIIARLGLRESEAAALLQRLVAAGYLQPGEEPGVHEILPLGNALANAKFLKPVSRARAEEIVRQLIRRIEAINANAELVYFVQEVIAFGSAADPAATDVADIDIVVDLCARPPIVNTTRASLARAKSSGRIHRNYLEELLFGNYEVIRLLKARVAYISIHEREDLELARHTKILFQADLDKVALFVGPLGLV